MSPLDAVVPPAETKEEVTPQAQTSVKLTSKPKLDALVIPVQADIPVIRTEPLATDAQDEIKPPSFKPFPSDTASFISNDSCDDAVEVITFSTPVRARRATATTIFSLKGIQALASPSTPSASLPGSPAQRTPGSPDSPAGSPKTKSMLRTLEKLEAASPRNSMPAPEKSAETKAEAPADTSTETPALCRSASDAPSASPSESDGIKTPASLPGTPCVQPITRKDVPLKPTPITVPLAPAAEEPQPLANFSLDLSPAPHPTGTLVGKAARAAALAAANDPLKPRRLLQLLPRQQARLAQHKRKGIFEPMDVEEVAAKAEEKTGDVEVKVKVESAPAVIDLAEDVVMTATVTSDLAPSTTDTSIRIDPEIGLPIPPASPKRRRPSLPKLPAHLDRSRLRADSVASRAETHANDVPRRWPAWPPQWDAVRVKRSRSRANTAASNMTSVTVTSTSEPKAVSPTTKKGHAASASVHTFGGSHCSSASVANLEEFGVMPAVPRNNSVALDNVTGEEVVDERIDFSCQRPRAGTTASAWSLSFGIGAPQTQSQQMDVDEDGYVVC